MTIECIAFQQLSLIQLHELYKLRSRVFVVEQNCAYQDVDDKDVISYHVLMTEEKTLIAYARIIPPGLGDPLASIGRVVVAPEKRGNGYAKLLMQFCIGKSLNLFSASEIKISAQSYLLNFYTRLGFVADGPEYPEDGIPHRKMTYKNPN